MGYLYLVLGRSCAGHASGLAIGHKRLVLRTLQSRSLQSSSASATTFYSQTVLSQRAVATIEERSKAGWPASPTAGMLPGWRGRDVRRKSHSIRHPPPYVAGIRQLQSWRSPYNPNISFSDSRHHILLTSFQHHHHPIIRAAQTQETSNDRHDPLASPSQQLQAVIKGLAPVPSDPCCWMRIRARRHLPRRQVIGNRTPLFIPPSHGERQSRQRQATVGRLAVGRCGLRLVPPKKPR